MQNAEQLFAVRHFSLSARILLIDWLVRSEPLQCPVGSSRKIWIGGGRRRTEHLNRPWITDEAQ